MLDRLPLRRFCLIAAMLVPATPALATGPVAVSLETFDGQRIAGDYYAPLPGKTSAPMVILLHMYNSDRTAWKPLIPPLQESGFAILAIDLRGHGQSATDETRKRVAQRDPTLFTAMYDDVRAAYDFLAQQDGVDRSRFALVGASVGSSVALHYAVQDRSVDAIVCLSPGANYLGLDSKADIAKIKGRKIWLVASDAPKERSGVDALVPLANVDRNLFPGNAHGTHMFGEVAGLEGKIADYLKRNVGGPSDSIVYGTINSNIYHLPGSGWIDKIAPSNMRHYSSSQEAEARGLRKARSRGPSDRSQNKAKP